MISLWVVCGAFAAAVIARGGPPETPQLMTTGRVLLLDHGGLIEGMIERRGGYFCVKQSSGEITVPVSSTMLLLPDKNAAYLELRRRIGKGDARQHAALARWCLNHGLKTQALSEAEEAVRLAPEDQALRRIVAELQTQASLPPPPRAVGEPPAIVPVKHETIVTTELPASAYNLFTSKVHPILINACSGCHARSDQEAFPLTRPTMMFGDRRATQLNLATVLAAVRHDDPAKSPLLVNALNLHGNASQPPLRNRESPAYRHLEEFVRLVTGKTTASSAVHQLPSDSSSPTTPQEPDMTNVMLLPGIKVSGAASASSSGPMRAASPAADADAHSPRRPKDEFDPTEFNQQRVLAKPQGK